MVDRLSTPILFDPFNTVHRGIPSNSTGISSTAYNGAAGHLTDITTPSLEADKDALLHSSNSSRSISPQREGFGSRLLSTLSNAQPAAAALRRSGSVLHSRTKSWASYVPKLNPSTAATSDKSQLPPSNRIFGDLFNGESAPIRLGIPTSSSQEDTEFVMEYRSGFTERPFKRPQRIDTASSTTSLAPRTSWFKRKSITPITPITSATQDEFLTMNIHNSLFPDGPADPLSPHAFNDLLLNATDLLQRMQASYREKVEYINSIQPEIDAQKEEAEEAETRAQHLKLQLEDMCRRAQDQDHVNRELALELSDARLKAHEPQQKTVRLVRRPSQEDSHGETDSDDSTTPRRQKRASAASASDSGFESDADTSSLFSSIIPDGLHPRMTFTSTPDYEGSTWGGTTAVNGMVLAASKRVGKDPRIGGESTAWSTVGRLQEENVALQRQIEAMQQSLQGCIDFVSGVTGK